MNRTALIYEGLSLDWFGVIVAAACLVGLCVTCLLRKIQKGSVNEILTVFCIGTPLALVFSRLQYCLSRVDLEELGIGYIFTGMHQGGYGLYGAMAGILAAILLASLLFKTSFGELADCVAAAGAGIIAMGRFATRFTNDDLGFALSPGKLTVNIDGLDYLAVFYLDGIVESVIFAACIGLFLFSYARKNSTFTKGNVALVFLMLHGLSQVLMDSLRTVTLNLFNNDFIKASQIIGIVSWLVIIVILVCRIVKKQLFRKEFFGIFAAFVVLIIISVRMEYRVGSGNYVSAHIVMGVCMVIMAVLSMVVMAISELKSKAEPAVEAAASDEPAAMPQAQENIQPTYSFDGDNNAQTVNDSPIQTAEPVAADSFAPDNDFAYTYAAIAAQQSDEPEFEDDFDYMYEEIDAADTTQTFAAPVEQPVQDYSAQNAAPAPANPSAQQEQHRISNDTLDELRRQFAQMDNM